jgi:hypothetical protein
VKQHRLNKAGRIQAAIASAIIYSAHRQAIYSQGGRPAPLDEFSGIVDGAIGTELIRSGVCAFPDECDHGTHPDTRQKVLQNANDLLDGKHWKDLT